ncbi:uncharacterized protein E6C27_scaffold135G001570 [Cucumis melo var. makuwa]|uniref:DUF4218 domain-containing protein n=1 Tax=Cucumis melo var. makuwa TaxID=1194695 RepID=A0A5A7UDB0_CUCMM|nr:uncharacterized protein E6C27_scaffold135G001570 [Cucumis melo var. makuwa]
MLNDLQAPIEHEEEIEEFRLEDEMPMNVGLMHVKVLNGWSNKSFDMLLELLRAAFPMCNSTIPSSFYEAKRKLHDLGLRHETIHACKYDCVLYWKEFADLQHCPTCGEARYKEGSADMRWHRDKRVETDDVLRHPADAEGWKHFDSEFPDFASDPRNVRLGLASDGFNLFGQMSTSYSMWPVVLLPYNLPPWKCMKETNFFMSLLIPGPKSPGREINVYLQPLIEELKELWTFGVHTYDSLTDQFFQLYAALLWTIDDFPAYGDLSGWSTKGYQACPICMGDRSSFGIREAYVMNESSTFCSRYLRGIETRFTRDERNDDTIVENEVIGDFEIFKQKVRPLGASSVRAISEEEKRLFHWYILNNADEISEYCKKHLRLQRRHAQNSMDLYKIHERAFPEWFRAQVLELRQSTNLSDDFFSLAMGPSFDVRCYNGCIVGGVRFHTLCRNDVDPTIVERSVVRYVTDDFIDDVDEHLSHASDEEL